MMREQITGRAREVLAEVLAIGQERGETRDDLNPMQMARAFQQAMFGTVLLWSLNPVEPLERVIDEAIDVLWDGMKGSQTRPAKVRPGR